MMLKRTLAIAALYLKTTYTSRSTFIFLIGMPLLFTFVLAQTIPTGPSEGQVQIDLGVVDEDRSSVSAQLIDRLEAEPAVAVQMMEAGQVEAAVDEGLSAAVVIPAGFEAALLAGEDGEIRFVQNASEISRAQLLQQAVTAAAAELAGSFAAAGFAERVASQAGLFAEADSGVRFAYRAAAFEAAEREWSAGAPVTVEIGTVSRLAQLSAPGGASQSSPGMLVMYALMFTFGGGTALLVERDAGTLRRLLVMPLGKGTVMAGKLLGIYAGALLQMGVMVLAGQFLFGVAWGLAPAALAVMLLSYGLAGTTLGLLFAALVRTAAQANAAGTIGMMALSALGGAWWPIEIVPRWMQSVALALPTGWAMRGFHDIITRGLGLSAILQEAAILVGFSALFLVVGMWRFRYE